MHHFQKRSDDVSGTRLELAGISSYRPIITHSTKDRYSKPVVFFLSGNETEDLQIFIDPEVNLQLHHHREAMIESQRRTKSRSIAKKDPSKTAELLENLTQLKNGSRGAQLILAENKKHCEKTLEKIINKHKEIGFVQSPSMLASKILNRPGISAIPKLGRDLKQGSSITFELSSSEDEDDTMHDNRADNKRSRIEE